MLKNPGFMEPSKIPVSQKYCTAVMLDVNRVGVARGGCRCRGKGGGGYVNSVLAT